MLQIAFYGQQHSARFLLALAETAWAISLFWPGDTFVRPTYSLMYEVANELVWATVFMLTAACQWAIFFTGKYHTRSACLFSMWNMLLWWYVVVSMYLAVYPPPSAISGEFSLAVGAAWVYIRSGLGVRRSVDAG